jgi:carboxymethylenebutenolidase
MTDTLDRRRPKLLASPGGEGPFPGIVLLSEAWGITPEIEELAFRLAKAGYLTAAPDVLSSRRPAFAVLDVMRGRGSSFQQVDDAAAWLADQRQCNARIGLLGLSMGASIALRLAATGRFHVAGAFYGFTPRDVDWSHACPIAASFGGRDRLVRDKGVALAAQLDKAGIPHDIRCYEESRHSFLTETKTGWQSLLLGLEHDPRAAGHAWTRTMAFFAKHL